VQAHSVVTLTKAVRISYTFKCKLNAIFVLLKNTCFIGSEQDERKGGASTQQHLHTCIPPETRYAFTWELASQIINFAVIFSGGGK